MVGFADAFSLNTTSKSILSRNPSSFALQEFLLAAVLKSDSQGWDPSC